MLSPGFQNNEEWMRVLALFLFPLGLTIDFLNAETPVTENRAAHIEQ